MLIQRELWIRIWTLVVSTNPHPKSLSLRERDFQNSPEPLSLRERGRGEGKSGLSITHVE
jgi:hypothetical protein